MRFVGPSGKKFDEQWREIPDDTPIEIPVRMRQPKSMQDMVSMYVHQAMKLQERMSAEAEALEEAEDLGEEGEEGDEILTPYELHDMAAEVEREQRRAAWLKKNSRAVRREEKRVPDDSKPGPVGQGEGREPVPGPVPGGGASPVRPVESAKEVRQGESGGERPGPAVSRGGS